MQLAAKQDHQRARAHAQETPLVSARSTGRVRGKPSRTEAIGQVLDGAVACTPRGVRKDDFLLDGSGRIGLIGSSITGLLGYESADLSGSDWFALLHPDDVAHARQSWQEVIARPGHITTCACRVLCSNGSWRHLDLVLTNLLHDPGVYGVTVYAQDVTEYTLLRERQTDLLLEATIAGQEQERERISLDIHDGVCQALATAYHYLEVLAIAPNLTSDQRHALGRASALVQQAIQDARDVVNSLRPTRLAAHGLAAVLQDDLHELSVSTGIAASFDADLPYLPRGVETGLYRIVQEALSNVARHAHCSQVAVRFWQTHDTLHLLIQDDGAGFELDVLDRSDRARGVGLISMQKRAELLKGSFALHSQPGHGTSIHIRLPVSRMWAFLE